MPLLLEEEHAPSVLPVPRLLLLLAASVGLSWFMVPRQHELVERLLKDKQYERVVALLNEGVQSMNSGDLEGLHDLSARQLAAIARLLKLTPREQLHAIFERNRSMTYDAYVHNIALAAIRFVDVLPPEEAFDLIAPNLDQAPESMRLDLLRVVARNAHSVSQPALAARAMQLALQLPASTWQDAREMVQAYRWSSRPGVALVELQKWLVINNGKLNGDELAGSRELHYTLALECSKPSMALDACLVTMESLPAGDSSQSVWMERARITALASGRVQDLLVPMARYVETLPEAHMTLVQLRDTQKGDPDRLRTYRAVLKDTANWSDWSSEFDSAFDAHLRLAVMGDLLSLDRCVNLQDFLGRGEDCVELLQTLGDIPQRESYKVTLARMLAELGEDNKSKPLYEAWLQTNPSDREARFQYCCLLEDMGDEHAARLALEELLVHHPSDVPAVKKLGDACIREGDYKGALKLYQNLSPEKHDSVTLENYAMISESLDDHESLVRALQLAAQAEKQPGAETYLAIADAASYLPDQQAAGDALREGLLRLPNSAVLRIALAQDYLKQEQPGEAVAMLLHQGLRNNYEAVEMLLNMGPDLPDQAKVMAFLGDDADKRLSLSEHCRLHLAVLNHNNNRKDTATRLFTSVKENAGTFHMLAEARMATHEYDEAAGIVGRHLHSNPRASAGDWEFLGDILEQMGRLDEAKQAYDTSIALLTADIPETAAN